MKAAVTLLLILFARVAAAQTLSVPLREARLENGLRVVLSEEHTVPTVAVLLVYDVGSRNEVRGRTGFAHLFEHMMFQGSAHVPKGGHFKMLESVGADFNGFTAEDRTVYYEVVPSRGVSI